MGHSSEESGLWSTASDILLNPFLLGFADRSSGRWGASSLPSLCFGLRLHRFLDPVLLPSVLLSKNCPRRSSSSFVSHSCSRCFSSVVLSSP